MPKLNRDDLDRAQKLVGVAMAVVAAVSLLLLVLTVYTAWASRLAVPATLESVLCDEDAAAVDSASLSVLLDRTDRGRDARALETFRLWALSQPDTCVRSSYLGWVEYYQQRVNKDIRSFELQRRIPQPPKPSDIPSIEVR